MAILIFGIFLFMTSSYIFKLVCPLAGFRLTRIGNGKRASGAVFLITLHACAEFMRQTRQSPKCNQQMEINGKLDATKPREKALLTETFGDYSDAAIHHETAGRTDIDSQCVRRTGTWAIF